MNPFNPNFGNVPNIFIDRSTQLKKVINGLDNFGSPYQTTLVYGLRGVGKTSFLTDISKIMSKKGHWMVINLAVGDSIISNFIQLIYKQANSHLQKILDSTKINFSAFGFNISYKNSTILSSDSARVAIETILGKLKQQHIKLLVTIDEVQSTPEIKRFATIYQLMRTKEYDISLIMTGLPDKVSELQNNDVLTFLLRSGRITLEPLDSISMSFSYQKAFAQANRKIEDQALKQMIKMTNGYAYGFQLLGYLVWETNDNSINSSTLEQILPEYKAMLYRNVYTKIYESLSPTDRKFVAVMVKSSKEKVPINEIAQKMKKSKNYISIYRRRLLDDQIIISKEWGKVSFTLPYFKDFVQEFGDIY